MVRSLSKIIVGVVLLLALMIYATTDANYPLGVWTRKADFAGTARQYAVSFAIPPYGYIGLGADSAGMPTDFWRYRPDSDRWDTIQRFPIAGRVSAVSFSYGTNAYVASGTDGVSVNDGINYSVFQYSSTMNIWMQLNDLPGWIGARTEGVGLTLGHTGYLATGNGGAYLNFNDLSKVNLTTGLWDSLHRMDYFNNINPSMARFAACGFAIDHYLYVGTGLNDSAYFNDFWQYDTISDTWTQIANFGGTARFGAVGFTLCNYGYVGLGQDANLIYRQDFWLYDPSQNVWNFCHHFPGTGRKFAVAYSDGNAAYVGTGEDEWGRTKDFYKFTCDSVAGVVDMDKISCSLSVFPNPNNGIFEVNYDLNGEGKYELVISDINGKLIDVYPLNSSKNRMKIDESKLGNGLYLYYLRNNGKIVKNGRFSIIK